MSTITVFGSSSTALYSEEYNNAIELGRMLASKGYNIATGGYGGIMEAILKGASDYDVKRIGIVLNDSEKVINSYVDEKIYAESYLERLGLLLDIGDAYIILPGGTGTLLELVSAWALKERKYNDKMIICVGELWYEMLQNLGFYSERFLESSTLLKYARTNEKVLEYL
jgi:uncharacterized protein (TIGR00730 family)